MMDGLGSRGTPGALQDDSGSLQGLGGQTGVAPQGPLPRESVAVLRLQQPCSAADDV
jgi:hypothetical protein